MGDAEIEAQLGYAPGSLGRMGILKRADDMLDHYTGWAESPGPLLPRVWSLYDDPEPSQFGLVNIRHPAPSPWSWSAADREDSRQIHVAMSRPADGRP